MMAKSGSDTKFETFENIESFGCSLFLKKAVYHVLNTSKPKIQIRMHMLKMVEFRNCFELQK